MTAVIEAARAVPVGRAVLLERTAVDALNLGSLTRCKTVSDLSARVTRLAE